jgi:hypothetical protein
MMTVSANDCSGTHDSRHPKQSDCGLFQGHRIICALQHLDIDKAALQLIMDTDEHARTSGWSVPTEKPRPFKSFD